MDSLVVKTLHDAYLNREMAWLTFARQVLALAEDENPLRAQDEFMRLALRRSGKIDACRLYNGANLI